MTPLKIFSGPNKDYPSYKTVVPALKIEIITINYANGSPSSFVLAKAESEAGEPILVYYEKECFDALTILDHNTNITFQANPDKRFPLNPEACHLEISIETTRH